MRKVFCDRCGEETATADSIRPYVLYTMSHKKVDLCDTCASKLSSFMEDTSRVEKDKGCPYENI